MRRIIHFVDENKLSYTDNIQILQMTSVAYKLTSSEPWSVYLLCGLPLGGRIMRYISSAYLVCPSVPCIARQKLIDSEFLLVVNRDHSSE